MGSLFEIELGEKVLRARDSAIWNKGYDAGQQCGWSAALLIYGMHDCTIKNEGKEALVIPVGRREAYIDLAPGEQVTLRTVDTPGEWWEVG